MLADDVVVYSDGGGKVISALRPVAGRDRAARRLTGVARKGAAALRPQFAAVNGEPGLLLLAGATAVSVVTIELDRDGRIAAVFLVNNPDKIRQIPVS
jgi:RNA polymerase sigma-70 factor, ECF subfamily